jgi:transcriptional regulator with PAS, ATPase and Fis domain
MPAELVAAVESDRALAPLTLKSVEKRAIEEALERHAGKRTAAAKELGIDPSTLYRKMHRYGIE